MLRNPLGQVIIMSKEADERWSLLSKF
uniref:Uncharacterized protein n=1 Tax=Anguilla anguilla TaxID=7936 RepID=A0A0E9SWZ1_ANGAN